MVPIKSGPPRPDPELTGTLSLGQLAHRWDMSEQQVRGMLGRQEIGFVEIRGSIRIPLAEVEGYESRRGPAG